MGCQSHQAAESKSYLVCRLLVPNSDACKIKIGTTKVALIIGTGPKYGALPKFCKIRAKLKIWSKSLASYDQAIDVTKPIEIYVTGGGT